MGLHDGRLCRSNWATTAGCRVLVLGQMDNEALINGCDPFEVLNPDGRFFLEVIGDCVAGRNIRAAILEGLRTFITL